MGKIPKMEITQKSINRRKDKVWYINTRINLLHIDNIMNDL